ncbi:MAG: PP0621 family protein [Gallionella sp.]|nr:PP0621 family protein [Gallionella sp.]MDD4947269.1 PP0621 family protein [Gallionella sp.]MDD5612328.1 PP0621 family protein [Gallionella sp.]
MSRLLFLFAIAALIYLLFKSFRKNLPHEHRQIEEDMVRCSHCGVHVPVSESLRAGGQVFCCTAHRDAGK